MFSVVEKSTGIMKLAHTVIITKGRIMLIIETEDGWIQEPANNYQSMAVLNKKEKIKKQEKFSEEILEALKLNPQGLSMRKLSEEVGISRDKTLGIVQKMPEIQILKGSPGRATIIKLKSASSKKPVRKFVRKCKI